MSLVGPRPLLLKYGPRFSPKQDRRHHVLPGITGLAQINGRNTISWEDKFDYDIQYVKNHSFWIDLKILIQTMFLVIKFQGTSQPGEDIMSEFMDTEKNDI
jgi:sugar transferase EpsL